MHPDPEDTIVALATAAGVGMRAIVRLSGTRAWPTCATVFRDLPQERPGQRALNSGRVRGEGMSGGLPADCYFWPGPRSYTGQDVAELHLLSSPPLVERIVASLLQAGARAALPGEFTMRAFLAGKLDLTRAEAVLGVIDAPNRSELKQALTQLAGGVGRPMQQLRDELLNLLADVEAGLDFSDEDLSFVDEGDLLHRLTRGLAQVTLVAKQMKERSAARSAFRVVLAGPPNAGKSSLFNALANRPLALVSETAGTTRDYLHATLKLGESSIELIDTAGLRATDNDIEAGSQVLGREQADQADLVLLCNVAGETMFPDDYEWSEAVDVVFVATKIDLMNPGVVPASQLGTSVVTGAGLNELRGLMTARANARTNSALAPSLSRCQHHVQACLQHLRTAHGCVLHVDPPEILALELRCALEELGAMVGAVYTDDLLDRIFSRFCIGK